MSFDGVSLVRELNFQVLLVLLVTLVSTGPLASQDLESRSRVTLTIDYGDGVQKKFSQIPWKAEMTILDVMNRASKHRRGIRFKYRGSGSTAFLTQLDDLANQGRERNWIYRVNGKLGDRSFAVYELRAGDSVLWQFGKYQ